MLKQRKRRNPAIQEIGPLEGEFRFAEIIKPIWLWCISTCGALLVLLAIFLDIILDIQNILPNVALSLGVGSLLFVVLFVAERKIIKNASLRWVSKLKRLAEEMGNSPEQIANHYSGPVAVIYKFIETIIVYGDYRKAWQLTDARWRLCRAQCWLYNNNSHPIVKPFDMDTAATEIVELESTHPLWNHFAETELDEFKQLWSKIDFSKLGAASRRREVRDGEVILLVDLSEFPTGMIINQATEIFAYRFLVASNDGVWQILNHLGDQAPEPGWPPNWNVGWTQLLPHQ